MLLLAFTMFATTLFAQTVALPQERRKLGGNDPSARITRESLHNLLMLQTYSIFDNLAFSVQGDQVTLSGQVTNPVTKSDAATAVKQIEGVSRVVNNIQVLPPLPMDNRIRREAYRTIFSYGGLSRYAMGAVPSIHIVVDHGNLTLVGVVDSEADKNMAGIQAKSVPGVFSVKNDLQVATK